MRRHNAIRAVAKSIFGDNLQTPVFHTATSAAAPSPVRKETADEHSELSDAYNRRIQEMYQAAVRPELDTRLTQDAGAQHGVQPSLPSLAEVADRLNSSKGASCSSSTSTTDSNAGIDWREALARLQAAEKHQLQENMLIDTFRCCPPLCAITCPVSLHRCHWHMAYVDIEEQYAFQAAAYIPSDIPH